MACGLSTACHCNGTIRIFKSKNVVDSVYKYVRYGNRTFN
jgi:hypothetical protein